jgi:hypothetical protein
MARLIAHLAWADQLVLESLERSPEPNPDSLQLLAHILAAEHVWISRLLKRPAEFPTWPALSKAECARLAERNRRELTDYAGTRVEQDLGEEVTYVNSAGKQFTSRATTSCFRSSCTDPIIAGRSRGRSESRDRNPTRPTTSRSSAALPRRPGRTP